MNGGGWRTLRAGRPDELVLAVDYWPGRTGAGFGELTAGLGGDATVLETVPPPAGERLGGARSYLDGWLAGIDPAAVRLVLGNCVGSAFAVKLAGLLGERAGTAPPPVVLFDPQLVDAEQLAGEFDRMTAGLGAPPAGAAPPAGSPAGVAAGVAAYADELAGRYAALVAGLGGDGGFDDDGLDDEYLDELVGQARRFLSYQVAAAEVELVGVPVAVAALASKEPCSGFGLAARAVRFDVARAELLARREVAVAVNDAMGVTT
jgi:hypothetical protein